MSWDQRFLDPIIVPGKKLVTLRDAALYITKLSKAEYDTEEWLTAMEALLCGPKEQTVAIGRPNLCG